MARLIIKVAAYVIDYIVHVYVCDMIKMSNIV